MPPKAVAFMIAIVATGFAVSAFGVSTWDASDPMRFWIYALLATVSAGLKIRLPGITGTMSVNFLFILMGVAQLTLAETLVMGISGAIVQSYWKAKRRPKAYQLAFNVATMSIAIAGANGAYSFIGAHLVGNEVLRLLAASMVLFVVNTVPVAAIVGLSEGKAIVALWKDCYFWSFPYYLLGASVASLQQFLGGFIGWESALALLPVAFLIYRSYSMYFQRLEAEKEFASEMAALHLRTIEALAMAIEAKDATTHDHLQRVQSYAMEIANELQLDEEQRRAIEAAALLHDIGKLAIPQHIISKPGKLTKEEFDKVKTHTVIGAEILSRVAFPYPVVPIVRHHHEKWNGTGYPDGLKGEEIPIGARVLAVVDCLDALISDRQYRRALPMDEALALISKESGESYDPRIVKLLLRKQPEVEERIGRQVGESDTLPRLHTEASVKRGKAPAAGLAEEGGHSADGPSTAHPEFLEAIAQAREEAQVFFEMTRDLGSSLRLDETLSVLMTRLQNLIPWDGGVVYLVRDGVLHPAFASGEEFQLFSSLRIPLGEGLSGWVAANNKPILNGNPSVEPAYLKDVNKFSNLLSALSVPLEGVEGTNAVLTLYKRESNAFSNDHLRILATVASKAGLSIDNALKYGRAENSATADYVTGLPNTRALFVQLDRDLSRGKRAETGVTIAVCDLDGFKQINDEEGHLEGNVALRAIGQALQNSCREYDCVARMGGDEFVVIFNGIDDRTLETRLDDLRRLPSVVTRHRALSMSVGIAQFPRDGEDAESLLAIADRRMYRDKARRKTRVASADLGRLDTSVAVH